MRNAAALAVVPSGPTVVDPALAARIAARAGAVDAAAAYPAADVADLAAAGWLDAPRAGLATDALRDALVAIGAASLTVGRLFEGHVNAAKLVRDFGGDAGLLADESAAGRPSGVWNAERGPGLAAHRVAGGWLLDGTKIHCSGAGMLRRPIVTARSGDEVRMFLPDLADPGVTVDLSVWRAVGMRGTATGTVTFARVFVPDAAAVGGPGDYYRSPRFSGGAWRVLAVQLGGLDALMALHADRLDASGRAGDAVIRARFADAVGAHEAARLLVAAACARAEGDGDPAAIDAYVDMARGTFEGFAMACLAATRRNVGLGAVIAPDPLDRVLRDLDTYLRQPFYDASRDNAAAYALAHGGRIA